MSTAAQADQYGPDRQRQDIERAAQAEQLKIIDWVEETISGANHERAFENRYYELARQHPGMNFIFSHPNRVGRHVEVTVGIARTIHRLGGTVWIAGLGNLRDQRNWRYFLRDAADAEIDFSNIVHQLQSGRRGKAASGRWPNASPPYGYTLGRDARGRATLPEINEKAAPGVRRCFDLLEEMGSTRAAEVMRSEGWPAPSEGGWTVTTVKNIMRSSSYTGKRVYHGITLNYPAIVSPEQWERVQAKRRQRVKESGPRDTSLLFAGHLRCATCGSAVGREGSITPYARYVYYRCWRSKRGTAQRANLEACTNTKNWRPAEVDIAWWNTLTDALTDLERLPGLLPPPVMPASEPPSARVQELEEAIARAWEPFAAGKVSETVAERLAAPYVAELERLKAEYAPRPVPITDYSALHRQFTEAVQGCGTLEEKRELLRLLDARLYIGPEGIERISVQALL